MNKVFKIIWNKSKCCFSVVSEIAKNHKKAKAVSKKTLVLFVSAFLVGSMGIAHVEATNDVHYISVKGTSQDADTNYNNDGAKKDGGIAIGEKAKSTDSSDIAIGSEASSAGGWGMAIGVNAQNTAQLGMAIGYATKVEAAQGLALGVQAQVTKVRGIGIGTNANVSGEDGISFGSQTKAAGQDAISIGTSASSSAKRGIAVGKESSVAATAARGIAIGDGAYVGPVTDKHKGTAMPKPGDSWTPSMPFQPTDDDTKPGKDKTPQENSLAIGMRASAFGYQNIAIGAAAEAHDTNSTAVGVAAVAKGHYSTALGKQARTYGQETTSVGHWADTRDEFATALGANSIAYKKGATALGSNARAYDENSVAIGANSIAKEAADGKALYTNEEVKAAAGIVSVGNPDYKVGDTEVKANYRRIVNVAGGILDHDAVNVAQLKAVANMVTNGAVHYISVNGESQDADSNYKNDGAKGKGAVAIGEKALASKGGTVSIGRNAQILGNGGNADGEGSVAIGDNTLITTNGLDLASIAIGKHAKVLNGSGKQERGLSFTPDNFDKPGFLGSGNTLPKNADKVPGGIAIGTNSYARTGSIQIGSHTFVGYQMGGVDITQSTNDSESNIVGMTTIGTNTYNKGAFANMYGAYSVITGGFTGEGRFNSVTYGPQNFGANVVGSLNSIRSKGHSGSSGIANSIVGVANTVENANGTLVYGAGNKITNSVTTISAPSGLTTLNTWEDTVTGLQKAIKDSNSGGAVLAIGGGNVADYVRHSQLVGVNNTVTGTENKVSEFNMVDGYKNTVTNGNHVTMIGSENTATDSESTVVMGDKQKVTKVKHGVLLGSQDTETETNVADVVAIGHNAHVEKEGGVALGSGSIASVDKGIIGYDPLTGKASTETTAVWQATKAALSIGDATNKDAIITRQITGVAAGTEDTDAVNVAQLKALATLPMNMYFGGKVENNTYTPGKENWSMPLNEFRMDFGDGLKATQVEKDGKKYTLITLDKESLKGDPAFKGDKGENGQAGKDGTNGKSAYDIWKDQKDDQGNQPNKDKSEKDFLDGLKGAKGDKGDNGADGKDGKSAFDTWKDQKDDQGNQPNKDKTEKDFLDSLKGKDGKDGTGADIDIKGDIGSGVSVTSNTESGKKTYTIGLGPKIKAGEVTIDGTKGKENVAVGDVKINGEKDKGTITGLSNKTWDPNKIESGRAATEDQLKAATQGMADISGEINHVGAHSAALAALHPLDFDPDEKLDIAAGVGNYNGSNAVAIGAYYRPNESTMISVGGSFGSGKNMVNAGVSVKVGQGNNVSRSRIAMAKEIKDMRAELETFRKAFAGISQGEKVDPIKMKLFPDVPENHWAYEYVKELVKQGVIDGYPDGTFKGDRMMTRYEFAAIFYKAMQKGINVNKKILDEFEVELERFRIDVIAKDKNGNPTIERIRVN
ncbi:S-layer homology domain-containing protein [Dialister micraerophilus]|nr:S-layer homology domain-containing protein [Dialister micraerophilus]